MNKTLQIKTIKYFVFLILFTLTGCSTLDSYRTPNQSTNQGTARSLPQIPEIKRRQTVRKRYVAPKKAVVRAPVDPKSVVKKYPNQTVQTQKSPQLTKQQQVEQAKNNATVDIDPYAEIPDSISNQKLVITSTVTNPAPSSSSPATKSLMTSARADIALGKNRSAISKLERGLRIEPQNAQLWHMLAKAHYANSAYLHAVSMAKKSNSNTNNSDLINENWKLIKLAGERSGNASVIKEALDYMKLNP